MNIPIKNRFIVLVGPKSIEKLELAKEISCHTKESSIIIQEPDPNLKGAYQNFQNKLMNYLFDHSVSYVILLVNQVNRFHVASLLAFIHSFDHKLPITVLKTDLDIQEQMSDASEEKQEALQKEQKRYKSLLGSYMLNYPNSENYVITDPKETTFTFPSREGQKKRNLERK